jgi:hypothetical protein
LSDEVEERSEERDGEPPPHKFQEGCESIRDIGICVLEEI